MIYRWQIICWRFCNMKLKKVLAGIMAVVTAVTASVCGMSVSAGAVSEKKEYTGYGYTGYSYQDYIPQINLIRDTSHKPGMNEVGKNVYEIWENIELTDTITFYAYQENGQEYILNMRLSNDKNYYISQSSKGYEKSGITVKELIRRYNQDLHAYDYGKVYEGKNVTISNVISIEACKGSEISYDEKTGEVTFVEDPFENEPNQRFTWKIIIEPGSSKNTDDNSNRDSSTNISSLKFGKLSNQTYTGKAIKPSITIKDGSKKLVSGTDYTVTYKNNTKPGKATATITGKGDYTGTKTVTFNIAPKKVKLSAKTSGAGAVLSWKKSTGATGYEIYYSTNGGKFRKLTTVKSAKYTAELTSGSAYKFRVRPYVNINGKEVYGKWSNTVSCK